jgi:stress-induced morphogen
MNTGQSLLERQRRVNECLKEEMTRIHALQMKTWTPAQYAQKTQQPAPVAQSAGEN